MKLAPLSQLPISAIDGAILVNEEGAYALEEDGDGNWYLDETECWVWGPLEVTDDEGNVRIIIADAEGNVTDFKDE